MKQRARQPAAFTLVELTIAVVIIAILAIMTTKGLRAAMLRAQITTSIANLRQLTLANLSYALDHGTYVPAADQKNLRRWHGARMSHKAPFDPAEGFLAAYLGKDRRVHACPVMREELERRGATFELGSGGYGYNSLYLGGMRDAHFDRAGVLIPPNANRVLHPSRTLMFASTAYANGDYRQEYPFCEPPFWDFGYGPTEMRPSPTLDFRFAGKALVSWCDGHVSMEQREDRDEGYNPHGGNAYHLGLGWIGPDEENGYWNPGAETTL